MIAASKILSSECSDGRITDRVEICESYWKGI